VGAETGDKMGDALVLSVFTDDVGGGPIYESTREMVVKQCPVPKWRAAERSRVGGLVWSATLHSEWLRSSGG